MRYRCSTESGSNHSRRGLHNREERSEKTHTLLISESEDGEDSEENEERLAHVEY